METVDVTGIDLSLLGHFYFGEHEKVIADMLAIFMHNQSARQRGLPQGERGEWLLR